MKPLDHGNTDEAILLAALIASAAARTEFTRLAVGPSIFSTPAIRDTAGAVLSNPDGWLLIQGGLDRLSAKDETGVSLLECLETRLRCLQNDSGEFVEEWAVQDVKRATANLAANWLPNKLQYAADSIGTPHEQAAKDQLMVWLKIGTDA